MWDYNKEITLNLEDALFSAKSMAIMFGSVDANNDTNIGSSATIIKTVRPEDVEGTQFRINGQLYNVTNMTKYDENGTVATGDEFAYATGTLSATDVSVITISPSTFPGSYYVTGDTYARALDDGKDEFFQLVLPKAKVQSEVTLTMEAEGDPSTFSMNLKVLKPDGGKPMMSLIKYNL